MEEEGSYERGLRPEDMVPDEEAQYYSEEENLEAKIKVKPVGPPLELEIPLRPPPCHPDKVVTVTKNSDTAFPSNVRIGEEYGSKLKPRNSHKPHHIEDFELDPPISIRRRSFHHKKQNSLGNDTGFPSSPIVPTYMAATESAKAKLRSMSSPRLRGVNFDACSESNSPYKHKLSSKSSINSEVTSSSRVCDSNFSSFEQNSPCLKGFPLFLDRLNQTEV